MSESLQCSLTTLNECRSYGRVANLSEQLLPHRHQQQRQFRGDDREQMMRARHAAEALFTPKPEIDVQPVPDPAQSIKAHKTNQSLRAPCGCAGSVERTRLTGVQSA